MAWVGRTAAAVTETNKDGGSGFANAARAPSQQMDPAGTRFSSLPPVLRPPQERQDSTMKNIVLSTLAASAMLATPALAQDKQAL